jgi:hypothetical protein
MMIEEKRKLNGIRGMNKREKIKQLASRRSKLQKNGLYARWC